MTRPSRAPVEEILGPLLRVLDARQAIEQRPRRLPTRSFLSRRPNP